MSELQLEFDPSKLFDIAQKHNAEIELMIHAAAQRSVKVNQGNIDAFNVSNTRVIGVRAICDERVGIAYSESFKPEALELMMRQAIDNAKVSQINPHEHLAQTSAQSAVDSNQFYQDDTASTAQLVQDLISFEAEILQQAPIQSCPYNGLSSRALGKRLISSQGLDTRHTETVASLYAYALAKDGDAQSMAGSGQVSRNSKQLNPSPLAQLICQETLDVLHGKPVKTGRYDVIFSVDCLVSLMGVFASVFSGKAAMDKVSPWRDRVGQRVAVQGLHLIDRPHLPEFGYTPFDDEGISTKDTTIIQDGILQTFLHNSTTANAFKVPTTGHASRSPQTSLNVASHQLTISPGTMKLDQLQQGQYLFINQLSGLHSGANAVTGDFSFGALGFLCKDGVRQQAVRGITVAGNFYQALQQLVIADDCQWNWQRTQCYPSLRFQELSVAGA